MFVAGIVRIWNKKGTLEPTGEQIVVENQFLQGRKLSKDCWDFT